MASTSNALATGLMMGIGNFLTKFSDYRIQVTRLQANINASGAASGRAEADMDLRGRRLALD